MPSWKAILFRHLLIWTYKPFQRTPASFHAHIQKERKANPCEPSDKVRAQLTIEETESGGCRVFHATPNDDGPIEARVLYIHGGSFIFDLSPLHWDFIVILATKLRARVTVPLYPLAPEHKLVAMYDMLEPLYDEMAAAKDGTPFWCMGDSAGGTFTLGLTQRALDAGKPMADRLVPISPCVDGTMMNPDLFVVGIEKDPMLSLTGVAISRTLFLGDLKPEDPLITTINGTIKGLPPMFVPLGTDDLLSPDAQLFVQKAKDNGCDVTSILGEGLFHVWFIFPLSEATEAQRQLFDWLRSPRPSGGQ
ncbi:Alpha/beta hydrolase fold-3 [Akanthomyces lecanii RCEF 1005]|uniref:Alpha/beta hydrolase fold-3 n=1 Tax=Akanthomyces lecanii RCEF 1005 TaxID=1081108 RepID=A0A168J7X2_CORDF|nr:Alpha/beta hydrolase fold-3 [Akanthomyces lecanii RCEF 1005]